MVNMIRRMFGLADKEVEAENKVIVPQARAARATFNEECHTGPVTLLNEPVPVLVPEDDDEG